MLSFDIRSLDDQAATVNGALSADDPIWIEGICAPKSEVRATGRLSVAGPGRYYWSGAIEGTTTVPCRRCLTDTTVKVAENVHVFYAEAGDEIDDPEVYVSPRRRARSICALRCANSGSSPFHAFRCAGKIVRGSARPVARSSMRGRAAARRLVDARWAELRTARGTDN